MEMLIKFLTFERYLLQYKYEDQLLFGEIMKTKKDVMKNKTIKALLKTNLDGMKPGMNKYKKFSVFSMNNIKNIEDIKW